MRHITRVLLGVVAMTAMVLWLSSATVPRRLLIAALVAAVVLGVRASLAQKRMERQWVRSLWTKWKSVV